ncbi:nucleolar protein 4-like b isoform X2 [Engraulis encrasicolus]|uniref:nucleolar protein 4-like b isoform X2 n=1 Tax=Engraulis encrasicolus TaxID=184585 RepID=UPI002FD0EF90
MSTKNTSMDSAKRSESPVVSEAEMFSVFQDWCLRTYGDSGKTKTVTRRKYDKILQTLLQGDDSKGAYLESNHINAKFKFWVKSKGFQVGRVEDRNANGGSGPVLYVPIKATCVDGSGLEGGASSLKRVAVVEDFYDIIYSMHVEISSDPGRMAKHAGQKKTYKAIAETYAFLPREAVTRFLMSCGECQKRMHINPSSTDFKENDRPLSLTPGLIDYNMPLTTTYLKQMKLHFMNNNEQDESSVSSEDFDMSDPTWISAEHGHTPPNPTAPNYRDRMHSPLNAHKEEDDDSSSESGSGNGQLAVTPPASLLVGSAPDSRTGSTSSLCVGSAAGSSVGPFGGGQTVNGNGTAGPPPPPPPALDFSTTSSSGSSGLEEREPAPVATLAERLGPAGTLLGPAYPLDSTVAELRRKYPAAKYPGGIPLPLPLPLPGDLRLDRDIRDCGNKSPQYSSGSFDSVKMEICPEDLTVGRGQGGDDDDDDHDDHDDNDKINDTEGVDPERLKAFNMFVRLFVDENLDRMVPISKQPKEKIQAIIESCCRQFPEFQERARKRIRTYLKSCRRMKKNGMETRPTPPHLTSAMAENILAAACESESRNAAKRMRMDVYQAQEEPVALEKPAPRESASLGHTAYSLAATAYTQDQLYINGGLNYSYRGYNALGTSSMPQPVSLTTGAAQSNGPTDLSMKSLVSSSSSCSSSNSHSGHSHGGRNGSNSIGAGGGPGSCSSAQLSPSEITAVRQLIAGYRESAAFLMRSADELENLILQQN